MATYTIGDQANGASRAFDVPDGSAYETHRAREDGEASVRALGGAVSMSAIETVALAAYCFFALAALTVLVAALVHYVT